MKNLTLLSLVAIVLSTSACTKIYECDCNVTYSDDYGTYSYSTSTEIQRTKKKDAQEECNEYKAELENDYYYGSGSSASATCDLDKIGSLPFPL